MALPPKEEYKFDVLNLADDLALAPATVRVMLRKSEIEKAGRSYGWNTQKEYESVLRTLRSVSSSTKDEKPVKASKAKSAKADAAAPKAKTPKAKRSKAAA